MSKPLLFRQTSQRQLIQSVVMGVFCVVGSVAVAKSPLPTAKPTKKATVVSLQPTSQQALSKAKVSHPIKPSTVNLPTSFIGSNIPATDDDTDDGGEVDISPSVGLNPVSAATALPTDTPTTTKPQSTHTSTSAIDQVPLGAVSPITVEKFVKMIDIIRQEYVTNVDDEALFVNAMTGTLASLDPYSEYLDAEAFENLRLFTEGDIGSIGVTVSYHADVQNWLFDDVLPNSPAAKAGIERGNFLHQINDNKLEDNRTQQDIDQLLTGIAGTTVRLLVSDKGRRKHTVTVQRSLVQQQTMNAKMVGNIAIVQIPVFQNNTQQQFLMALAKLNQPFSMIVLDIRNNPGGVLSAANDIGSLFLKDKVMVEIKNRHGLQEVMRTHGDTQFADIPLVILQNRYSASAAEVLASSLQNNQRAKIYGDTSYGKGSIQSIVPLDNDEAVKLTVAHYYSSKGEKIDGVGIKPDYPLTGSENTWETQLLAILQTMPLTKQYQVQPMPTTQAF